MYNIAYIDGQNLHLGTFGRDGAGWKVDFKRFRRYLLDKYCVKEAYYFLGFVSEEQQEMYTQLQKAGFILEFREHSSVMKSKKKGNVDSDIVFEVMKRLEKNDFDKICLVSGDGDYIRLAKHLHKKLKLEKVLFPNTTFASSLYNSLGGEYFDGLDKSSVREKIEYKKAP